VGADAGGAVAGSAEGFHNVEELGPRHVLTESKAFSDLSVSSFDTGAEIRGTVPSSWDRAAGPASRDAVVREHLMKLGEWPNRDAVPARETVFDRRRDRPREPDSVSLSG
jgi:hypothetical protein